MNLLFVTSEMAGLTKVGDLGEVFASLPRAVTGFGVDARVLIPRHRDVLRALTARVVLGTLPGLDDIPAARIERRSGA